MKGILHLLSLTLLILSIATMPLASCSKDEPEKVADSNDRGNSTGHVEGSDNSDKDDNDGSNDEDDIKEITGRWTNTSGSIVFNFETDGSFSAIGDKSVGFHVDTTSEVNGHYKYNSFKRFLWLSINGENEIYMVEFSCRIQGDEMTLYGQNSSRAIKLNRTL